MAIVNISLYIQYNANGGSNAPSKTIKRARAIESDLPKTLTAEVSTQAPTRDGYIFAGWAYSASASSAPIHGGDTLSYTFTSWTGSSLEHTYNLYAVWVQAQYNVYYRPGSYATETSVVNDIKYGGVDLTLRGRIYTRPGYNQTGWSLNSSGSGLAYALGGKYSTNATLTLYPYWSIIKSTISSVTDSVPADGATQGTVFINKPNADFSHTVLISLGTRSQEFTSVDTSLTFTIPAAWLDQIPNATSAVATVSLTTYKNGSQVGTPDTKSFVVTVPSSIVPTITLTGTNQSSNNTVSGWNVLVQGYSQIALTANAAAGSGATITSIAFSGEGVSQIGTGTTATSDLLTSAGAKTWTATVTDSRGRTATATLTRTVHEYYPTAILSFSAFRSTQEGNASPSGGQYITASGNYSLASCNGYNSASVKKIEYKVHNDSAWTQGEGAAASGTVYTFGPISLLYNYDVKLTVTDALGSSASYTVNVASVRGVSFGLNGRCARFGGPVQYDDRFECDWDMQVDGQVEMPLFLQTGVVASEGVASGTTKTIDIEFETEFATQPYVAVSIMSPQTTGLDACAVTAWNITQTGFSARLINGYEATRQLGICWIAAARKNTKVAIITQPIDQSADIGDRVAFAVEAINATAYQWYSLDPFGDDWEIISGDVAKYAEYIFEAIAAENGYSFRCIASNSKGSVESDAVTLTINGAGPIGVMEKVPYSIRDSGGDVSIGNRMIDKIVGGTIVWNQLLDKSKAANSGTFGGISVTKNGDGSITCNGTATSAASYMLYSRFSHTEGHKYLLCGYKKIGTNKGFLGYGGIKVDGGNGGIVPGTNGTMNIRVDFMAGDTFDNVTMTPMIINLTQMFGSTIADYIYSLEQATANAGVAWFRSLFPNDYYVQNVGELMSVNTSAHRMVGFNQWDEEWELGGLVSATGQPFNATDRIRSKNFCRCIPSTVYYCKAPNVYTTIWWYDASKGFIKLESAQDTTNQKTVTSPFDAAYFKLVVAGNTTTYGNNLCLNLDGERDGEYEPYREWDYPLDSSLTLRGILKLDASNNLYYDGDEYESNGTVTRKYEYRSYASGDESLADAITDGTHTVVKLITPTTETADPYTNLQDVDPNGTEEYVDYAKSQGLRDVSIPVGHETKYKTPN